MSTSNHQKSNFGVGLFFLLLGVIAGSVGFVTLEHYNKLKQVYNFFGYKPNLASASSAADENHNRIIQLEALLSEANIEKEQRNKELHQLKSEVAVLRLESAELEECKKLSANLLNEKTELIAKVNNYQLNEKKLRRAVLNGQSPELNLRQTGHMAKIVRTELKEGLIVLDRGQAHGIRVGHIFRPRGDDVKTRVVVDEIENNICLASVVNLSKKESLEVGQILVLEGK